MKRLTTTCAGCLAIVALSAQPASESAPDPATVKKQLRNKEIGLRYGVQIGVGAGVPDQAMQYAAVDFAAPQVDPKTGTFGVRAIMPNPRQELLPGQFTRVKLLLNVLENATVVPRKAVSIEKGGAFIYVIRPDSIVEKRFIETGYEQGNSIVVNRGLLPGERIVVEGYNKLTHGQPALWVAPKQPLEDKPGDEDSPQEENIHFLPDSVAVPADTIRTDTLSAAPTGKDSIPPTTPDSTVSSASATDSVGQQPADTTGQATSVNKQEGGQAA